MVHIHRPKQNKQEVLPESPKAKQLFYGIRGLVSDSFGADVFAQREDVGDSFIYRIMAYRNRLYNPYMDSKPRDYEFKPVTQVVFNNYLQFLSSQREAYLNEAEREYSNG